MPTSPDFPARCMALAEKLFKENSHNCAEAVCRAILLTAGRDCPVETVRLASAFGRGMGGAGCACGALVGGQMAVGAFFGREAETGYPPDKCAEAAALLHKRFQKENGATCCRILHKGLDFGTPEQLASCCARSAKAAEIAAGVIQKILTKKPPRDLG